MGWHAHTAITRTHRSSQASGDSAAALGRERSMRPTQARPPGPAQMWLGDAAILRQGPEEMWLRSTARLVWTARASNWPRNARSVATPVSFESSSHSISSMPHSPGADVGSVVGRRGRARLGVPRGLVEVLRVKREAELLVPATKQHNKQHNNTTTWRATNTPSGTRGAGGRQAAALAACTVRTRPAAADTPSGGRPCGHSLVGLERLEADRGGALAAAVEHFAVRVQPAVVVLREQVPCLHDRHLQLRVLWAKSCADVAGSWRKQARG
jgi:hypothetical protein